MVDLLVFVPQKGQKSATMLWNAPPVLELASKLNKTPAQILLRWALDNGVAVVPKTARPERMRENSEVFGFILTSEDIRQLNYQFKQAIEDVAKRESQDSVSMGRLCWRSDPLRLLNFD